MLLTVLFHSRSGDSKTMICSLVPLYIIGNWIQQSYQLWSFLVEDCPTSRCTHLMAMPLARFHLLSSSKSSFNQSNCDSILHPAWSDHKAPSASRMSRCLNLHTSLSRPATFASSSSDERWFIGVGCSLMLRIKCTESNDHTRKWHSLMWVDTLNDLLTLPT